jgi:UDP-N-acetylglucosamine diphosphorylase / glucose-1-phosphate thymidylyltransferase / UDP-N-acetylgalactosamine diphosphorylase / glucosamine-1-phosphate N-acetyltransferase / galactosamine-1-phosphate N-acetyltransferase
MRLIVFDPATEKRLHFFPLALSRPIFELRCGMTSLLDKLVAKVGARDVACFVPEYLADSYKTKTVLPVNDASKLAGSDLLIVNGRVKAAEFNVPAKAKSHVAQTPDGEMLYAWLLEGDLKNLETQSLDALLESAAASLPRAEPVPVWNYVWDLVLENPAMIAADFRAAGRSGVEGAIEEPSAIRGSRNDVYIAPGVKIHPMAVIDAEHGPVYLDEGVEVHPFTRIEGPCYVGKNSILFGAKCREGNSIGPMCRVGGEVEESIIHGYSNKYHDGFLGHAYVGEWVNLGAMTTNSDLKNDYSPVSVVLDGKRPISTGSTKVGSLIGDHTKTSIGTLFNTGAYVGAMALIAATGKPLPKFIPCFAWFLEGAVTKGFGKKKLYETAKVAMSRRKCQWTEADEALWDIIFQMTAPERDEAVKRGRRRLTPGAAS